VTGVTPVGTGPSRVEHCSVDGAVAPTPGERLFLAGPHRHSPTVQSVLQELSPGDQATRHGVRMDNGSCQTATALGSPHQVVGRFLPPYRPELNPIARLCREMTAQVAWRLVATLAALEHHVARRLTHSTKAVLRALTSYPYVVKAVHAVGS
jgi:putative transposase